MPSSKKRINILVSDELFATLGELVDLGYSHSRGTIVRTTLEEVEPVFLDMLKAMRKVRAQPKIAKRDMQEYLGQTIKDAQMVLDAEDLPDDD
jgi:hypothetical protein